MNSRDKETVQLVCQDCGKVFLLSYGRYRRLPKDNHWRCKECNNIKRSRMFANLTEEERAKLTENRSMAAKKVWDNLTADEYIRRRQSQKERWAKLTDEEKANIMRNTHKAHAEYVKSPEFKSMMANMNHQRWTSLSEEDREKELIRLAKIRDEYWDGLTVEEKFQKMMKMWMSLTRVGPTEFMFNDLLKSLGMVNGRDYYWGYNTYPYIHPDYYHVFGKTNILTGEENIPYHSWDFILFPNTDRIVLIDIDGSAHDPKMMNFKRGSNTYTERAKIDYNDSQRSYQIPDGAIAYVIRAYDDNLSDNTIVKQIGCRKIGKYKSFIEMISKQFTQNCNDKVAESSSTIDQL